MGTIYLIRHGETGWNREQRLQGIMDVPLSRLGIIQAQNLAGRIKLVGVRYIFTSPLRRARHTALILHRQGTGAVIINNDLREN